MIHFSGYSGNRPDTAITRISIAHAVGECLPARHIASAVLLVLLTTAATASDSPDPANRAEFEQRLQTTGNEIRQLDSLLQDTRRQRSDLQARLQQHNGRLDERSQRLQQLQKEIQTYEGKVRELENQVSQQQAALAEDRRQLATLLRQRLISSRSGQSRNAIKTAFSGNNISLSQRKAVYISHLEKARQARINSLQERVSQLELARHEALKSRNWLSHLSRKAEQQHADIHQQQKNTSASIGKLASREQMNISVRQKLLQEQKDIETMLQQLDELRSTASGYFAANRGKLPWPVNEAEKLQLLTRFGEKKAGGKLDSTGLLIKRKKGRTVRAIADGEVVYADLLAALGMVVVIDHGDGYLSLYGGNGSTKVQPGDWVEMGSTIATVGRITGPNAESTYLEIRENAVPVNPEKWLDTKKPVQLARN